MFVRFFAILSILMLFIGCDIRMERVAVPFSINSGVVSVISLVVAGVFISEIRETVRRVRAIDREIKRLAMKIQSFEDASLQRMLKHQGVRQVPRKT